MSPFLFASFKIAYGCSDVARFHLLADVLRLSQRQRHYRQCRIRRAGM
jgi:hypothetical protein